jgi:hypothetical protein
MKFMMFFQKITSVDQLIMRPLFPSKQRKLSHLIAMQGHLYLLKDMLKQIDIFNQNFCHERHISDSSDVSHARQKHLRHL